MKFLSRLRDSFAAIEAKDAGTESSSPGTVNTVNGHFQGACLPDQTKEKDLIDVERQAIGQPEPKKSVYQGLGWLDRLLALWILLAIIVGILLGNYVDSVGPALQRGKFVQVSVPIGQ